MYLHTRHIWSSLVDGLTVLILTSQCLQYILKKINWAIHLEMN